jgi:hypothetical protein
MALKVTKFSFLFVNLILLQNTEFIDLI